MKILYLEDSNDIEELINALNNMHPSDFNSSFALNMESDHVLFPLNTFLNIFTCSKCEKSIDLGFLKIDTSNSEVLINGVNAVLSKREYDLLVYLISQSPKIVSRDKLFVQIWRKYEGITSNTIEVHINKLRKKIGKKHIVCVKGFGYKFVID